MSTKIYDGLLVTESAPALLDMPKALNPVLAPVRSALERQVLVCEAAMLFAAHEKDPELHPIPTFGVFLMDLNRKIDAAKIDMTRNPWFGIEFSMTFIGAPEGRILARPYFQRRDYFTALMDTGWFREYGYWNNSDPDPTATQEEWEQRERDWTEPFEDSLTWTTAEIGLTYEHHTFETLILSVRDWSDEDYDNTLRDIYKANTPSQHTLDALAWAKGRGK